MEVFDFLKSAIDHSKAIDVIYHAGSQPGTLRRIKPLKVTEVEVKAWCFYSDVAKLFKLIKIEIPEENKNYTRYGEAPIQDLVSLIDLHEKHKEDLIQFGWHVNLRDDRISLHGFYKNGNPKRGAAISLTFSDYSPTRPYRLSAPDFADSRTYGKFSSVAKVFLEQAEKHALVKKSLSNTEEPGIP